MVKVLTTENNKKLRAIAACEAEIEAESDRHRQEVALLQEEKEAVKQSLEHSTFTVGCETKFLEHGLENYDKTIAENAELEAQKGALEELRSKEGMRHAMEVHRIKKEMIELRQQIELTFRKAVRAATMRIAPMRQPYTCTHPHTHTHPHTNALVDGDGPIVSAEGLHLTR